MAPGCDTCLAGVLAPAAAPLGDPALTAVKVAVPVCVVEPACFAAPAALPLPDTAGRGKATAVT
jgi:hypothetical protein